MVFQVGARVASMLRGRVLVSVLCAGAVIGISGTAQANPKYAAMVVDHLTGKVLHAENEDAARYPASLTKVMTLFVLFDEMRAGRISKDDRIRMTTHAAGMPPSKIGLKPGSTIRVEDAIRALVTKSANDVAAAVGEHISGSEAAFAQRMTRKAREIGMSRTVFRNASGLPDPKQVTTARDLVTMSRAIMTHHPDYYSYFQTKKFTFGGKTYGNHNKLLGAYQGTDGIKTGYTRASGFNLTTSVRRDNKHVVAVVLGGRTGASRDAHMKKLVSEYMPRAVARAGAATPPPVLVAAVSQDIVVKAPAQPVAQASVPLPVRRPASTIAALLQASRPLAPRAVATNAIAITAPTASAPIRLASAGEAEEQGDTTPAEEKIANAAVDGWTIQVGAVDSPKAAKALLDRARTSTAKLATATPFTEETVVKGVTFIRARFGGFGDRENAQAACAELKKASFGCYAVAPAS